MRRKKPDLLVVLAVLIGLGVLVTEVTYGQIFTPKVAESSELSR
jgi:hypothetical protein